MMCQTVETCCRLLGIAEHCRSFPRIARSERSRRTRAFEINIAEQLTKPSTPPHIPLSEAISRQLITLTARRASDVFDGLLGPIPPVDYSNYVAPRQGILDS
jgi:hypothetical protein